MPSDDLPSHDASSDDVKRKRKFGDERSENDMASPFLLLPELSPILQLLGPYEIATLELCGCRTLFRACRRDDVWTSLEARTGSKSSAPDCTVRNRVIRAARARRCAVETERAMKIRAAECEGGSPESFAQDRGVSKEPIYHPERFEFFGRFGDKEGGSVLWQGFLRATADYTRVNPPTYFVEFPGIQDVLLSAWSSMTSAVENVARPIPVGGDVRREIEVIRRNREALRAAADSLSLVVCVVRLSEPLARPELLGASYGCLDVDLLDEYEVELMSAENGTMPMIYVPKEEDEFDEESRMKIRVIDYNFF